MGITSDELKALKNAETIVTYFTPGEGYTIDAVKRVDDKDGFGGYDRRIRIHCEGQLTVYARPWEGAEVAAVCDSFNTYDRQWRTIVDLLRAGDELHLKFVIANDSDTLREHGITHDEVRLIVKRTNAKGVVKEMEFYLNDRLTTPTSLARMVRFK